MAPAHTGPVLAVDLAAVAANWRLLAESFTGHECAAVVKANAYGLGVAPIAGALARAGCRTFFVATLDEGIELRALLNEARIGVFHGPYPGEEPEYLAHRLLPVLNHPDQFTRWAEASQGQAAALHVDTGMHRLGFSEAEVQALLDTPELMRQAGVVMLLSHLACANEPDHPKNATQTARFAVLRARFPGLEASLCNSAGIFLPPHAHHDLARPGCALYGINPVEGERLMRHVATLTAPILQIHTAGVEDTLGYGATAAIRPGQCFATVQIGYADGYLRHLSSRAQAHLHGIPAPIVGRVSMDMIVADISAVPEGLLRADNYIELLSERYTVDDMARDAGTIGYEVLTRLGRRVRRVYADA